MSEMTIHYTGEGFGGQIPDNIMGNVVGTYSTYIVETTSNTVTVKVLKREDELVSRFYEDVNALLSELAKKNDVLAAKLARRHGFKQPKST